MSGKMKWTVIMLGVLTSVVVGAILGVILHDPSKINLLSLIINLAGTLIGALGGALVGAKLTRLENKKFKTEEEKKQDTAVWNALRDEIDVNYSIAKRWLGKIEQELELIETKKEIDLHTLEPFYESFSEYMRFHIPMKIRDDYDFFKELRYITQMFYSLNIQGQSRQNYKIRTVGMENTLTELESYNNLIKEMLIEVIFKVEEVRFRSYKE
ncbi:hypothetical protein [Halobacillus litoralis]|uniref:hypothetical protein n=1 Tax=Halobacillus litoralis TaxID=45668 RepID=UPI001CFE3DCD|nr:hypothetical protein [Halobacillus litoralis]